MKIKFVLDCEIGGVPRKSGDVFSCSVLIGRALISAGVAAPYADNREPIETAMLSTANTERR